jgi:hypothetical protein
MIKARNLLYISAVIIALVVAVIIFIFSYIQRDNGSVTFIVAPTDLQITYDNKTDTVHYNQTVSMVAGTYDILFSREGFSTEKQTVSVQKGQNIKVYQGLVAYGDIAQGIMASKENSIALDQIGGYQVSQGGAKTTKDNPILKVLPIEERDYTVKACSIPEGYKGVGDDKDVAVCISSLSDENYQQALQAIKDRGGDVSGYLIRQTDN